MNNWDIKTLEQVDEGWRAEIYIANEGRWMQIHDIVVSPDGFHWRFQPEGTVPDETQNMLTDAVGDMVKHGIRKACF